MSNKSKNSHLSFAMGVPALIWQVLFFYLPLAILVISSFIRFSEDGRFESLTLGQVLHFLSPAYVKVIFYSITLALFTAIACFFIGYPLAHFIAFRAKKYKNILLFLLIVPFWTNFLLHIYAWFFVLDRHGFINTILMNLGIIQDPLRLLNSFFAIIIMMLYFFLPFMVLPIYSTLERFDYKLIEASYDLGATTSQTFKNILLPLSAKGIRGGFFLVFVPAFGEFAIPELMGGGKYFFAGNVISLYILGEQTGSMGAAFTLVSCIILIISALFFNSLIMKLLQPKRST